MTYYCGFDPTAPSLHLGNLVQLITMRRLQLAGHKPLGLVGGSTGLIGDPRPTSERTLNIKRDRRGVGRPLQAQVARSSARRRHCRGAWSTTWTGPRRCQAIDFLRDIGKHFRVDTM